MAKIVKQGGHTLFRVKSPYFDGTMYAPNKAKAREAAIYNAQWNPSGLAGTRIVVTVYKAG